MKKKSAAPTPKMAPELTPLDRTNELLRRIVSVPKDEAVRKPARKKRH
jgi:hypothetical protein